MVAKGLITNGLGGDASSMILGQFNLGFLTITIGSPGVVVPPEPPTNVGADSDSASWVWRDRRKLKPWERVEKPVYREISIKITRGDRKWIQTYMLLEEDTKVLVRVIRFINRITTNIKVQVDRLRRLINKIRIK